MVTFPNAKINLGLNILSKRPDGYHNIQSCFYPIPFSDILEVVKSDRYEFVSTGISIPGNGNLCTTAFELIQKHHRIGNVKIHLHKVIPIGAGLGGGSADATFTLKALNELFDVGLTDEELEKYAATLGSDCPFFVKNQPVLATGTGTDLSPFSSDLSGKYLMLISPGIHVSTAEAYGGITPQAPYQDLIEVLKSPIEAWKDRLVNDFESPVFSKHPEIEAIKRQLYEAGALYASMTGSGSAVYGIFDSEPEVDLKNSTIVWSGELG